jgi:hypothetical protein
MPSPREFRGRGQSDLWASTSSSDGGANHHRYPVSFAVACVASLTDQFLCLLDPLGTQHGGRIVAETGDGALIEFPSVVQAVNFATKAHALMAERNADVPDDKKDIHFNRRRNMFGVSNEMEVAVVRPGRQEGDQHTL